VQHAKTKTQENMFARDKQKSRAAFKSSTANTAREIQNEHVFVPDPGMNEWKNARVLLLEMTEREYKTTTRYISSTTYEIHPSIQTLQ